MSGVKNNYDKMASALHLIFPLRGMSVKVRNIGRLLKVNYYKNSLRILKI